MAKVLVIAPHPDDEVIGCGGAIQWHKESGDDVYVHIVANRVYEHAENDGYLKELEKTIEKVSKYLAFDDYCYSALRDEQLDNMLIDIIMPIEEYVKKVNPDIVYMPNDGDTDQDHRAVASACRVACRGVKNQYVYEVFGPSKGFVPNYYIALTEDMVKKKIQALQMYTSEVRAYPHPRSEKAITILSQSRGIEAGVAFAESFRVKQQIIEGKEKNA